MQKRHERRDIGNEQGYWEVGLCDLDKVKDVVILLDIPEGLTKGEVADDI